MIKSEVIPSLLPGDLIFDTKQGAQCEIVSFVRGKICGTWLPGVVYRVCETGETSWRSAHDFEDFEVVNNG
jgi:hypothetical protein